MDCISVRWVEIASHAIREKVAFTPEAILNTRNGQIQHRLHYEVSISSAWGACSPQCRIIGTRNRKHTTKHAIPYPTATAKIGKYPTNVSAIACATAP